MLTEKEWRNFSTALYLVSARTEWYEEKAIRAWAKKTGGCIIQQDKHVRWCVEQLHVSTMLPSHLTDTISVHTVVTEPAQASPLRNSAYSKRLAWRWTEDRNPSAVGSTMEMERFPPWSLGTLIYWLYSSFRIHLPAFHYELCPFTSLLSQSMENVSMLKNNILLACFCCCFFYVGDEAIMALLPLSHIQSLKSLFWINHRIMNSPLHKAIHTWF